jgi:hypothetical protein
LNKDDPKLSKATLQRHVQQEILNLKDAVKAHLVSMVDQGMNLRQALFAIQPNEDGKSVFSDMQKIREDETI